MFVKTTNVALKSTWVAVKPRSRRAAAGCVAGGPLRRPTKWTKDGRRFGRRPLEWNQLIVSEHDHAAEPPRKTRPGGRTAATLARIYGSTLELLRDRGLSAVTFNDVAKASDVNRSTLYRRWPDRNELVLDAIMASVAELIVPAEGDSLAAELADVLNQIGDYLNTPIGHAVLAAGLELSTTNSSTGQRQIGLWRERLRAFEPMFERAQDRGELDPAFDWESAFAMAAGAIYYRTMIHHEPIDAAWINRIVAHWKVLTQA